MRKTIKRYRAEITAIILAVSFIASAFMPFTSDIWLYGDKDWTGASTRSLLFALGGIAGLYGLVISRRRLDANQEQVDITQKMQFSEALGRGVESLADKKSQTTRTSGIRVLENLAKSAAAESDERDLICNILNDFVRERAAPPRSDLDGGWRDIKIAIRVLGEIAPMLEASAGTREISLNALDLHEMNLEGLNLERANLHDADLRGAVLNLANLQRADLQGAKLQNADMWRANLRGANLLSANLQDANLCEANLQETNLNVINLRNTELEYADVTDARLQGIKTFTLRQLADLVYEKGKPPILSKEFQIPAHQAYTWEDYEDGRECRRFVESDEEYYSLDWITPFSPQRR